MLSILVSFVFNILNKVASLLLAPVLWVLSIFLGSTISPIVGKLLYSIPDMFRVVTTFILLVIDLLCIPRELFVLLSTIIIGILGYVIFARIYIFGLAIYRHFKP